MENNLELNKSITFDELVKHGLENGANVVNGMPWSWKINGSAVTHENDNCYLIQTVNGSIERFERGSFLIAHANGLRILVQHDDIHAPGGCPM